MTERVLWFKDVSEWQRWLGAHHATESGAVLRIAKKAVPRGLHYQEALEAALCYGWIDGRLRAYDPSTFLLRFTPRRSDSVWSKSNRERAERLIREGRMARAGLASIQAAKRSGAWAAAYRAADVPRMPSDLREALRTNPMAWSHFEAWAATYRSACIRYVTDAKRDATRREHIRRVVQRAAEDKRPGIEGF